MQASSQARCVLLAATAWLLCACVCPCQDMVASGESSAEAAYLPPCPEPIHNACPGKSLYWDNPCDGGRDPCQRDPWCLGTHQALPPTWYVSSEVLALYRYQDSVPFQSRPELANNGSIVLESSDVDGGFGASTRLLIGRSIGDECRIEASYFGAPSWSDDAAVRNNDPNFFGGTGNLFSPFFNFGNRGGVLGVDFNTFASLAFSSTLHNGEINIRRRVWHPCGTTDTCGAGRAEASVLIGLRYTRFHENLYYFTRSNVPPPMGATNRLVVRTENDMLGLQLGWLSQFNFHRRTWIDFDVKGVVFYNQASQQLDYTNVDNTGFVTGFIDGDAENVASFMVDLSLMLNYQFAHSWTLRVGYNGIFVMGAALAADNFRDVDLSHSGSVTYHGPSIALVWTR